MTTEQAVQILEQVCAGVQTNLQGHQQIQTALAKIKAELSPKKKED